MKKKFNILKEKIKIFLDKIKILFLELKDKFMISIAQNPIEVIAPTISLLVLLVSIFSIGFLKSILIFVFINLIYFIPIFIDMIKKIKTKRSEEKNMGKTKVIKKVPNKKINKKKVKKGFKIFLLCILVCFILGIIGVIGFFTYIVISAPEFDEEMLYVTEPTLVYDKDGNEIAKLGEEKRVTLTYDEIPEVLIDAIIATEDSRFFEHNGVDWARFLKASFYQLLGRSDAGGASTLTMQVSKNNISQDKTSSGIKGIIRKFTDVYVSLFKIEKKYTKQQIMEFYVNTYWLGSNSYGVEQISLTYFGKSAKDLNLAEAAMIAGLFQAPGTYNPYTNPEATETRRQTVLKLMKRHGYINQTEYDIAKELTVEKLVIPKEESILVSGTVSEYQSFIDMVAEEVEKKTGYNPYTKSMEIYTTLDTDIQDYINDIMNGESHDWENEYAQAGIAVINIKDGSISAIGGNRKNDAIDNFNYATDLNSQIGSTAKPLYDYGPAIEYENWSTYQILVDEPISYSDGHSINNWDNRYEGFETMRKALKGSRNIPALKAFKANNKKNIIEFVTNLGLTPEIYSCDKGYIRNKNLCISTEDPSIIIDAHKDTTLHEAHAIGGYNGESPVTLTAAYAAFANKGVYNEPHSFTKLIYRETDEEYVNDVITTKAMSEETAYMVSDMLATTATQAMSWFYDINGVKYAAKTGTTNFDYEKLAAYGLQWSGAVNDLWTVGFNTEYAIGVWHGYDYDKLAKGYYNYISSGQHLKLFQNIGKKVFKNKDYFSKPSGVVSVTLEKENPEPTLPSEYTPSDLKITELFIRGTEPTNVSQRFAKLESVSNLNVSEKDGEITLTWDEVETPEINTEEYLKKYFRNIFENDSYLNDYVNNRLKYIEKSMGTLGYNIYLEDEDGNLELKTFTSKNEYKLDIKESGKYKFVVKTCYSAFKSNMSDGTSIETSVIIPSDDDNNEENEEDQQENQEEPSVVTPDSSN